jgi:H+/Cl- antiporter ClcA
MDALFYIITMLIAGFVCVVFERWLLISGRYRSSAAASVLSFASLGGGLYGLIMLIILPMLQDGVGGISAGDFFPVLLLFLIGVWGSTILEARARKKGRGVTS